MIPRARNYRRDVCSALAGMIASTCATAATVVVQPFLSTSLSQTDNVTLAPKGEEQRESVLTVSPGVTATGQGSRLNFEVLYVLDAVFYLDENEDEDGVRHLLRGTGSAVIEEDLAFVDATAWVRKQPIDPSAGAGLGDIAVSENASPQYTVIATLSPYVKHTFGSAATVRGGLNFDVVDAESVARDSYGREIALSAESGTMLRRVSWNAAVSAKEVLYKGVADDYSVRTADVGVRYQFLDNWSVLASAGYLNYDFEENAVVEESPDGSTWRAGLAYSPSTILLLQAGVGEHYFGALKFLNITYDGPSAFLSASYDETVTTVREAELAGSADAEPDPVTGTPTDPTTSFQSREDAAIYVSELSTVGTGYRSTRLETSFRIRHERRRFETISGEEIARGGDVSLRFNLSPRTSLLYTYNKTKFFGRTGVDEMRADAKFALLRELTPRMRVSADVQRVERRIQGASDINDYVAHVYSLRTEMRF
jgi:uncharacterized protein (PEP-CTERM system associated)